MKKKNQTKSVNKEAFRMLAVEIGLNEACRKLGVPIPTGKSWARRGGWQLPKRTGGRPCRTLSASSLNPIADVLVATHKDLETTTKTALMQTTAKAAASAAQKPPLDVSNTSQLRDLAQSAARIFGWDSDKPGVQLNQQFCISQAQLEQIRQLRGGSRTGGYSRLAAQRNSLAHKGPSE
jgi:hypothetical protein